MQNPHVKYLKTKNGFHLFYYEHGSILCRHYAEEIWSKAEKITESASPIFSLCQYQDKAHLLYSNVEGQLFIASSNDLFSLSSKKSLIYWLYWNCLPISVFSFEF